MGSRYGLNNETGEFVCFDCNTGELLDTIPHGLDKEVVFSRLEAVMVKHNKSHDGKTNSLTASGEV